MKTKILSFILLFLLLAIGLQCKKEQEPTTIETWGYVIDEVTKKPLEGVKVSFYTSWTPTAYPPPYSTFIDSTYTDAKGYFYKKWTPTKEWTQMRYTKQGYYYSKDSKEYAKGDVGTLHLKPNKNFRLYIKNIPPVREKDSLYVHISPTKDFDYISMPDRWFIGDVDTLINLRIVYDRDFWKIEYFFKDSTGAGHYYSGNPYCTPHDTCDIYIEY